LWQFLGQHEPFDQEMNAGDSKFDHVVEMRAEWEQDEALRHAVHELAKIDGVLPRGTQVPLPQSKVDAALHYASTWTPSVRKEESAQQLKQRAKAGAARYYGIAVDVDVKALVEKHIPQSEKDDQNSLWSTLVKSSRVERKPHVTLVHRNELESPDEAVRASKQALWDRYSGLVDAATKSGKEQDKLAVELTLGPRLVWDGRAMSLEVSALTTKVAPNKGDAPHIALVDGRAAHITVGTRSSDIRPVEGKFLMETVFKGGKSSEHGGVIHQVQIGEVKVPGKLSGLS
jgi:tRNA ligase